MRSNRANAPSGSTGSGSTQTRQRRPGAQPAIDLTKELEAARAVLGTTNKSIDDFIRETAPYRRAETAAFYQRLRVEWVVKEARLMETQMSQQSKTATSKISLNSDGNKKRQRDDDKETHSEPWPKKTRRGGGGAKDAVSDVTSGKPRRSQRLAKDKTGP